MAEVTAAAPAVQGSTVQDAADRIESLMSPPEQSAEPTEAVVEATAAEVPEPEAPQEAEEPEETPEEANAEPAEQAPTLYTVKVDGEEKQVTPQELINSFQFTAANTRKAQELAATRKATEAEMESARKERALYAQLLPAIEHVLTQNQQPPDLDKLYQEDPIKAITVEREWRKQQEVLQQARNEQQRLNQIQEKERAAAHAKFKDEESKRLIEAIPEWKDQAKAKSEAAELINTAKNAGFTDEELNIDDHRLIVLLRKASQWDRAQATRAKLRPATPAVRPAKPGASPPPREVTEVTRAKQRLAKTGSVQDAASVIERMLN